ncbi:hypothetical protein DLAC_01518 [Tieghemostelium lacteum]|uniref:Uncharacterized protein n=1 Tax=Tieghemostelium lacteum TaxID=361077 RepID=A0A152A5M6_TIELA|nr:hypothetical protein DLAC_01518 [Tieghemostelium lacteum]|eukprot:KYR01526.1 hypothetical protein DLAC_01518 [Tieghemostelium lacteum]
MDTQCKLEDNNKNKSRIKYKEKKAEQWNIYCNRIPALIETIANLNIDTQKTREHFESIKCAYTQLKTSITGLLEADR